MGLRGCGLLLLLLRRLLLLLLLLLLVGGDRLGCHGGRRLSGAWWVGLWRNVGTCCRDFTLGHLMRETKGNLSEQVTLKCIQHSHNVITYTTSSKYNVTIVSRARAHG